MEKLSFENNKKEESRFKTTLEDIKNIEDQEFLRKCKEFPKEKVGNKDWLVPAVFLLEEIHPELRDKSILDIGGGHIDLSKGDKSSIYPIPEEIKKDKNKAMGWLKQNWKPEQDAKEAPTLSSYLSLKEADVTLLDPEANADIPFWQVKKESIYDKNLKFKNDFDVIISSNFYPSGQNQEESFREMIKRAYGFTKSGGINIYVSGDNFGKNALNDRKFLINAGFDIVKTFEYGKYTIVLLYKSVK